MGTTVALHVASKRPTAGLILQSPPPLAKVVMLDHGWWNLWLVASARRAGDPVEPELDRQRVTRDRAAIFITCDADTLVKPQRQQLVIDAYAAQAAPHLHGKGHNDSLERRDELAEFGQALDWLAPSLAMNAPPPPTNRSVAVVQPSRATRP
jgi:pimeloyl-ACP methyl ester carboxylesterase